jgi:hypothetical protein
MSSTNINNILEDTIQRFFMESNDISFNYLREWVNVPILQPQPQPQPENVSDTDSIPDLIDPEISAAPPAPAPVAAAPPSDQGMHLWSNVIDDYHSQMRMYQENIRTILDITQNFLPQTRNPIRNPPPTQENNSNLWRDLLRNNTYSVEIERILPSLFTNTNTNTCPTASQISSATTIFTYDISNNPLISTTCPISLEEFQDGEQLTRIIWCGHVFKTAELSRWFIRNAHCPSCRYDIRRNG